MTPPLLYFVECVVWKLWVIAMVVIVAGAGCVRDDNS